MIGQVLTELEIEGESCAHAVEAVEKVTARPFQIVIIDWGSQPDAGFLLNTARDRKPAERPLTLAIVNDDASVPTALQAGANSVLRKPLLVNQVKDTLATARDLLRAKMEPPAQSAAAAGAVSAAATAMLPMEVQSTLHAGEFLQPSGSAPSPQFETESSDVQKSLDQAAASEIDPLRDLEPTAAPVSQSKSAYAPSAPPAPEAIADDEPRGLAWYLKSRASSLPAEEPAPEPPPQPEKAQLLGYDQPSSSSYSPTESYSASASVASEESEAVVNEESAEPPAESLRPDPQHHEEAALFAYITGDKADSKKEPSQPRPWLKKLAIAAAVGVAAAVVYFTVPQALVQKDLKSAVGKATSAGHSWLNPQAATPAQVQAHESFGRAGDEYKLPVAENIPDANTDPSQIRVLPVVDPTVKPTNNGTGTAAATPDQSAAAANPTVGSVDPAQADPNLPAGQAPAEQVAAGPIPNGQSAPNSVQPSPTTAVPTQNAPPQPAATVPEQPQSAGTPAASSNPPVAPQTAAAIIPTPAVQTTQTVAAVQPLRNTSYPATGSVSTTNPAGIPSSLKSSMAQMSPDASGNKPPEAALPSIEPVNLPEAAARGLLLQGPSPVYPPSARGQAGSVVLQVLIGRDGSVQDAKFLQGSLAFARPAIDAVKQWRFKPYLMNGRAASTQTLLTIGFRPSS